MNKVCFQVLLVLILLIPLFIYFHLQIIEGQLFFSRRLDWRKSLTRKRKIKSELFSNDILKNKLKISPLYKSENISAFIDPKCFFSDSLKSVTSNLFPEEDLTFLKTEKGKNYKTILAWRHAYGIDFGFGLGRKPFERVCCREKSCFITTKRNELPIKDFDAILFHHLGLTDDMLPSERSENQRWIFYETEPPPVTFGHTKKFVDLFNWTMTYREDSDLVYRYGFVLPKKEFPFLESQNKEDFHSVLQSHVRTKTKMAAWFVSHCKTSSFRESFVDELRNYITVDIYGKCGPLKCSRTNQTHCNEILEKNYKFYLSFENSLCKDYVTEKFFKILKLNIVPVVYGSANYATLAPPHSYINARDFKSIQELANYLQYLNMNNTAYFEYFKWKNEFVVAPSGWVLRGFDFCKLCKKLHDDSHKKSYYNIRDWFITESDCADIFPQK